MKEGPDIARIGMLIGDPARANMLTALMDGRALTATELAGSAGVTLPTASAHLSRLEDGGLIAQRRQGRHRYFALADSSVAHLIENIMGFAATRGHMRHRPGPKDEALRQARICYDHLAGDFGVRMLDSLIEGGALAIEDDRPLLTAAGRTYVCDMGIDVDALETARRPLCKCCLDWSERRFHLSGSLGKALLSHILAKGLAKREPAGRAIRFTREGESRFLALFPLSASDDARKDGRADTRNGNRADRVDAA
ncbi:helix-turn-helix transcriptional regulator [Rhizobium sp. SSA_523]|uniref:ArsR/SmtB family transcription factor n=1 Tax=Rhizobium sp. SSA_523 TaxID=2952477 RepID=UPI0020917A71|nr:winged helix-turn-helix domain-containing protein [Rhizobium sp. SSA_523]MCO5731025.1 winged helix-turn-helix domain-containing protein [Rhizobium sp. SSA_523]WKC24171.1 winged helix-turn-helix domain-containing protein [Rhizobium sp. SSA_523]